MKDSEDSGNISDSGKDGNPSLRMACVLTGLMPHIMTSLRFPLVLALTHCLFTLAPKLYLGSSVLPQAQVQDSLSLCVC